MKVLFDCVLIKEENVEESKSTGGIVLQNTNPESTLTKGEVVDVGGGKHTEHGVLIQPSVTQGENVLYNRNSIVDSHTIDGVEYVIIREENIVAIVD